MLWKSIVLVCFAAQGHCVKATDKTLYPTLDACIDASTVTRFEAERRLIEQGVVATSINEWCEKAGEEDA